MSRPSRPQPASSPLALLQQNMDAELNACEREPIHLSGAIQPHGLLLAVDADELLIRQASANVADLLGLRVAELIGAPLSRALGVETVQRLCQAFGDPHANASDPLQCTLLGDQAWELTWHRIDGLVIVELERSERAMSMSVLFADVQQATQALAGATGTQRLCDVTAREVKALTGYERVMVYRFHPDEHGEVVAEQRESGQEPFLGLHYPASDIPRQARKLYQVNHLRVIVDVDYTPVPLVGDPALAETPLDLSFSSLRSVSPFHLAYLRNMGVQATLTISLMRGTQLWGMLACHHSEPKHIGAQMRAACRLIAQVFSLQVVAQERAEREGQRARLAEVERQVVARMSRSDVLADALVDGQPSPLLLTEADSMVVRIDGRVASCGEAPPERAIAALHTLLRTQDVASAYVCHDLPARVPEFAPFAEMASGVVAVPLSAAYEDFIFWFRGEFRRTVSWGGDPEKPMTGDPAAPPGTPGLNQLGPRTSFDSWIQQIEGQSRPWLPAEVDSARSLAAAIPDLLLAVARDRLAHLALHDILTGLPNRALLLDRTVQALSRVPAGRSQARVAALFIDLDRFKLVNDALGHAAGDSLLTQAGARLQSAVRETDTVARVGGDEFVVLCERISQSSAKQLSDRIVQAFRAPFLLDGNEALVTASIGIAFADAETTPAGLLRDADTAMYRAKNSGRNATARFTPEMRAITLRRVEIESSLRPAIERGDLRLHYQPIWTVDGKLTGFEALARWPLAGRGMVPPDEFIPVAESIGMIGALTEWVLDEALKALVGWRTDRPELTMAVNFTASQMTDDHLHQAINKALRRHHLPATALCLEITETALVTDDEMSQQFLRGMRDQGVRLSIDDFGTGFSALSYLTKLPVHELKIDRAFIAGLPAGRGEVAVVASVVGLAHQLGLQVLAEGIETDEQFAAVRRLGCDLVQGYLRGRPMPAADVDRLLSGVESASRA